MKAILAAASLSLALLFAAPPSCAQDRADCRASAGRLAEMVETDQKIRAEWMALEHRPDAAAAEKNALQERWRAIDSANLAELKTVLAACGWPGEQEASHHAWLLVQHADNDLAFQRQAKALLQASVQAGIGAPRDLAYLADRIAANEGRPLEYGTQFMQTDRCHLEMLPVDDVALANRRRQAIGLSTMQEYEAGARRRFIPADCQTGEHGPAPTPAQGT